MRYVSGNSRPSSDVAPSGCSGERIEPSVTAVMNAVESVRGNFWESRWLIFSRVNPSGKVTLVYVSDGGVRNTRITLPM